MAQHIESTLTTDKLKAGYVLNQEIPSIPGLKPGRVLTPDDVEQLKSASHIEEISVFIINKNPDAPPERPSGSASSGSIPKSRPERMSDTDRGRSLYDPSMNQKLVENLEKRKTHIRGVDYENEVEKYRQKNLDKFSQELKYVQSQTRQASLLAIEHYARTKTDFERIKSLEGLNQQEMIQVFDKYALYVDLFQKAVLTEKKVYTTYVESIVLDMLEDIGYNLSRGLFALALQAEAKYSFMVSHTLMVLITSLVTAIELTNIINEKTMSLTEEDINTFLAISKKSYTLEHLINLGVAALLHDIDIIKQFPDLQSNHKFSLREEARIDLHPSNGFHLAKMLNLDFDIQRSIFQHHERFDESGYPNGAPPRLFTKYTPLIMFAEYYVEVTTENPFVEQCLLPRKAIVDLLSHQRSKFDGDVVYAYLRAASLFPVGSWLKLSNGNIAVVSEVNHHKLDLPRVLQVFDQAMKAIEPAEIDLSAHPEITIIHPISLRTIQELHKGSVKDLLT